MKSVQGKNAGIGKNKSLLSKAALTSEKGTEGPPLSAENPSRLPRSPQKQMPQSVFSAPASHTPSRQHRHNSIQVHWPTNHARHVTTEKKHTTRHHSDMDSKRTCNAKIRSSIVFFTVNRDTFTVRVCPMRCARSIA